MADRKLEDPTVDVCDVEKFRLAFLMQFFVQHKRRFRFPRLRLQDLYQRVVKHPEMTAFCDLVARILRFLSHGDPDICIDNVDHALDRFAMEKRTPYRINMQRHRNGKPVHQLGPAARAALLENLIESVYDEQPDFNFTAGFNPPNPISNNGNRSVNGATLSDSAASAEGSLFGDAGSSDITGDFGDTEDVNVLIKAGQDAQGCSYYYMDDLRLYRERPQSGLCSQWDVAVGPTANQWQSFIASLSRNEKEYDLYCFLNQELFELVKQSLDSYELHTPNHELDAANLRTKEANELVELRRRKGAAVSKINTDVADGGQLPLGLSSGLTVNGPKSASPAFSGGHGACNIGSLGSASSGAPLTPSSARTPTSAPPATASSGYQLPVNHPHRAIPVDPSELSFQKSEAHVGPEEISASKPADYDQLGVTNHLLGPIKKGKPEVQSDTTTPLVHCQDENHLPCSRITETNSTGFQPSFSSQSMKLDIADSSAPIKSSWARSSDTEGPSSCPSPTHLPVSGAVDGLGTNISSWPSPGRPIGVPGAVISNQPLSINKQQSTSAGMDSRIKPSGHSPPSGNLTTNKITMESSTPSEAAPVNHLDPITQSQPIVPKQVYSYDPSSGKASQDLQDYACGIGKSGASLRSTISDMIDPATPCDGHAPFGSKTPIGPATALVPPLIGIPDGGPALTQEQWENRKSKIAQLEKIHSTLSKSKSASTPGAVNAAANGAALQQRIQQNGPLQPIVGSASQQHGCVFAGCSPGASYQCGQRQLMSDAYCANRPVAPCGVPPTEMAQREWDRLCTDYQRDKTEPSRFHPSCRQQLISDSSNCPIAPLDPPLSPLGTGMAPSNHALMDSGSCSLPPRQYVDGPPVMMVPPNNSNFTMVNTGCPPTSLGSQHYRYASSLNQPEHLSSSMTATAQKRAFYGPPIDPWFSSYNGPSVAQPPTSDSTGFSNISSSMSVCSASRMGCLGSVPQSSVAPILTDTPTSTNAAGATSGRPTVVGKVGGKKRKTVSSGRVNAASAPVNQPVVSTQQAYPYCKSSCSGISGSVTPNKPSYPSSYMPDPSPSGFNPHRSVYPSSQSHPQMVSMCPNSHPNFSTMDSCFNHYPDLPSGPSVGRSIGASNLPVDSRRALTPKGSEMFLTGPIGSALPCNPMSAGRVQPNCGPMFTTNGPCNSSSIPQSYLHPSEVSGPMSNGTPGSRTAVACTQHLTSASLASLARLSQLSGPEGPYVSSASSAALGSNISSIPGSGSYSGRLCHSDNPSSMVGLQHQVPTQTMRGHLGNIPIGMKMHDPDISSSVMYPKFGSHIYHGPPQAIPPQSSAQLPPHNQHQSQQPPSIQVNNTFFNAQLNVQQMNYQHVTAPGSTGQMQIHFVQQQQGDASGVANHGNRPTRPSDPMMKMGAPNNSGNGNCSDYYPGSTPINPARNFAETTGVRLPSYGSQIGTSDAHLKSEGSVNIPAVSVGPSSASYGNTSIQITPRTPHTIQYLPAVVPSPSEPQHGSQVYSSADSSLASRSKPLRGNANQYNFPDPSLNPSDMLSVPDSTKVGSFHSGPSSLNHPSTYTMPQQQFYQQQFASQQQPTQSTRNMQQAAGSSWSGSAENHLNSNSCSVVGPVLSGPTSADVGAGGRTCSMQPSCRAQTSGPPFSSESTSMTDIPWSSENSGLGFSRIAQQQFGRQQSAPNRPDFSQQSPSVQSHTQRQQQYQQHQMFMSSSMGNFSDGNQVQFMMSASSSSVQASSTTSIVNTVNNVPPNSGSSESTSSRSSSSSCNQHSDIRHESQLDSLSGTNPKRVLVHAVSHDDQKVNLSGVSTPQLPYTPSRTHWSQANNEQYSGAYCYSTTGGLSASGPSVGFFDPSLNNREMLATQQSVLCDMPSNMPQTFSSSILP